LRFLISLILCLPPIRLFGQAAPLSVNEAVSRAVQNNPRLRAAVQDIVAAQSGVRSARALINPTFLFVPALTHPSGSDEELLLTQPLELNGTRSARTGIAEAQRQVIQAEAIVELRNVVYTARTAYYELARAEEQLTLARTLLTATEEFDRITRRFVELGSRPGIDQVQTGIELTRTRQQVTLAEGQSIAALAALNTIMGKNPDDPIGTLTPLSSLPDAARYEDATTQALASRAEIRSAQARQDVFRQEARLARAEGRPDLAPQFRAETLTRGVNAGLGIAVTLPLFDWGSRRNRIRQSEESARAQESRVTAIQNQIRQEVAQASARLQAAEAIVRDYQQGVLDQAKRLMEARQREFQIGAANASVLTVFEAQRTYRSVQTDYLNALVALANARAEWERAVGAVPATLLPRSMSEPRKSK
jgi:outer membrane protein TolC